MASIAKLNQHVAALLGSTSGLAVGASLGWNSLAGQALHSAIGWETSEADLVCVALPAAAGLGAICLPGLMWMSPGLSTSQAIAYIGAPHLAIGWIVVCLADYSYPILLLGRCLTGLGVGVFTTLIPLYTSEISTHQWRNLNLVYFHTMLAFGIVCSYASSVFVSTLNFDLIPLQLHSVICMVASVPALLCCYAPESLLQRLDFDDSEAIRQYVEREIGDIGDNEETRREIEITRKLVKALQQPKNQIELLRDRRFWRVFAVVTCVTFCQHLSGSYPVTFNALTLIDFAGSSQLTSAWMSLVCAKGQTLGSILALALVTRLGRRILLTISSGLMGFSLILLGWYIVARETDPELNSKYSWIPATCIGLYFSSYGLGLAPLSSALLADSFPVELRVPAAATIVGLGWFLCLALNLELGELLMNLGISGTLWLFGGFCLLGSGIAGIAIRDSGTKSLAIVQEEFQIR